MTFPQFDKFQAALLAEVVRMKDTKGKEYANSDSRFANFDRLSVRLNTKPTTVALVYLTKHMDAIESYIAKGRSYSTETIQGRIVDAITYLTLIAGMIEEEQLNTTDNSNNLKVVATLDGNVPAAIGQPLFISRIVANNLKNEICPVCKQSFRAGENIKTFTDGHYEHEGCELIVDYKA